MLNGRLVRDHLYGNLLFTWLSLVMSMMVSFVLSIFPRDVLCEIRDLIESISEGLPTYFYILAAIVSDQHKIIFTFKLPLYLTNRI